ncbi:MAG: aspartate/glutamate racemase family protein [Burkholderiales bacterium]|nr:aspartate/glutamate racemase family protein [Burkholderiales bacterium]
MTQAAYRIGLMVPANNTTMESELLAWLPQGSTCSTLRIPRGKGLLTPADLPAYVGQAMTLAQTFAGDGTNVVIYGCTAAGFMSGPARDAAIAAELAQVTGKPVLTTASAMTAALKHQGVHNIALVTPYSDYINRQLQAFLAQADIKVGVLSTFGASTVEELAAITPEQIAERARKAMRADCDAMFIACSQLPTRMIIPMLEKEFKRPVWSSIRATAWQAERALEPQPAH